MSLPPSTLAGKRNIVATLSQRLSQFETAWKVLSYKDFREISLPRVSRMLREIV